LKKGSHRAMAALFASVLFRPAHPPNFWGMITVKQALFNMKTGEVFSLRVVSYDRKRKKGGEIDEYHEAVLLREAEYTDMKPARAMTPIEAMKTRLDRRDPNHQDFKTANIRILQNGHPTSLIKKIHLPLLVEFNGKTVVP
jgi:hypothetical protein